MYIVREARTIKFEGSDKYAEIFDIRIYNYLLYGSHFLLEHSAVKKNSPLEHFPAKKCTQIKNYFALYILILLLIASEKVTI